MTRRWVWSMLLLFTHGAGADTAVSFDIETLTDGLHHPWTLEFIPDGSMLITERVGQLRVFRDGELLPEPVSGVPKVAFSMQGGLFDIILDPDFERNQALYLSYAAGTDSANATQIVRATFDGETLREQTIVFTASPEKSTPAHFGGRLAFLPDGTLLAAIGEGFTLREQAQKLDSLLGKVVRIDTTGGIPSDNPFANGGGRPEIWTWGHRNPQALLYDAGDDAVYLHEHGPRGGDELNRLAAGRNYGWPAVTHGRDYSFSTVTPYTELPGMEPPLVHWTPSIAPSGMAMYRGALFRNWDGDLLITALVERSLRRIELQNGRVVRQHLLLTELGERLRDVTVGPDGAIYILTDGENARLLRITPATTP